MRTLVPSDFVPTAPPAKLDADEIHLWIFTGADASARSTAQRRLRETLAAYLASDPDALRIERNASGKPCLADSALHFNLSHSGGMLLLGLSRSQPLGVDIEGRGRERPYREIARRYFSADETNVLAALPAERLRERFLELWSAKEAVLKAIGRGLAFGLDRVGFALDAGGAIQKLAHIAAEAGPAGQWQIVRLAPAAGMTGALAWHGPAHRIRAFIAMDFSASAARS
jgi:4'-phosphopantetheinyl transferase